MTEAIQIAPKHWRLRFADGTTEDVRGATTAAQALAAYDEARNPPSPLPNADDVRREAQRRIVVLTNAPDLQSCLIKQLNALMRATELTNKKASGGALSAGEAAEAASLQFLADGIKAIRAASNAMEGNPPADYSADHHWPVV